MRHGSRAVPLLTLAALAGIAGSAQAGEQDGTSVSVTVTDLRSGKGVVRACLTPNPKKFYDCRGANVVKLAVPAGTTTKVTFDNVRPGRYAIALLHDENNNDKADSVLGMMPKEGFGFSRDAPARMGPPKFEQAAFQVGEQPVRHTIRMRYIL